MGPAPLTRCFALASCFVAASASVRTVSTLHLSPLHLSIPSPARQFMIFKITDDKKSIVVEEKGAKGADFPEFCSKLPDGDCRYAVLDVEINTKSGATTNKLIFVAW